MSKNTDEDVNSLQQDGSVNNHELIIDSNHQKNDIPIGLDVMPSSITVEENDEPTHSNLTEKLVSESNLISMAKSKNKSVLEYLDSVEPTGISVHEKLIDLNDSESEESDQLKPLIVDNHSNNFDIYQDYNCNNIDNNCGNCELNKDIISSAESDMSTQFDQHDLIRQNSNDTDNCDDIEIEYITRTQLNIQPSQYTKKLQPREQHNTSPAEIIEIDTLLPSEIPNDQLCEDIVEQVEYYFSNESLLKDAFLLKHVRRNKEGFVSLKLISSFKRVRQFTKDWRVVGQAVRRKSKKIELNNLSTKIRRLEPLPIFDETMPSRTIVVCNFPFKTKLSVENVSDIFAKYGEIALIRILKPDMAIPVDVRQFMNKYPEMQQKECALIEYIDSHSARTAKNMVNNCTVYDMVAPKKKTGKKAITTITKLIENYQYPDIYYEKGRGGNFNHHTEIIDYGKQNHQPQYRHQNYHDKRRHSTEYFDKSTTLSIAAEPYTQLQQSQPQPFVYQPPNMPMRRHSTNSQDGANNHPFNIQLQTMSHNKTNNTHLFKNMPRKYSSQSESYSSSDGSRKTSLISDQQNCSSECCNCSRRISQYSNGTDSDQSYHRKLSQYSDSSTPSRRFSNESYGPYDSRNYIDSNYTKRKLSNESIGSGYHHNHHHHHNQHDNQFRKYSNSFDPLRKLSSSSADQYYNGRRISVDSGYDRKLSFGSDYSTSTSPRSRTSSFISATPFSQCQQHNNKNDTVVRTPIGPDGSKGFTPRMRKIGQTIVPPVI